MALTTVEVERVVEAFGVSEIFPRGSERFEALAPFIGHLIQIVGEEHLGDKVDLGSYADVSNRFLRWLATNDQFKLLMQECDDERTIGVYLEVADQYRYIANHSEEVLECLCVNNMQMLEMESVGLNAAAKVLNREGELTFAALLATCPDVFVPKES